MTPEGVEKLKVLLGKHEGYSKFPYLDSTNHLTIGIGRNLTDRGISKAEAFQLLDADVAYFSLNLIQVFKFYNYLDENRQIALVDMCFNLGLKGLLSFKDMLLALECKDYERAANEMLLSKWASQVGGRSYELSEIIRTGKL